MQSQPVTALLPRPLDGPAASVFAVAPARPAREARRATRLTLHLAAAAWDAQIAACSAARAGDTATAALLSDLARTRARAAARRREAARGWGVRVG